MKTNHRQRRVSTNTTQQWTTFLPPKAIEILTPFPDPISPQCSAHGDTRSLSPRRGVNGNGKSGPIHSLPPPPPHPQNHSHSLAITSDRATPNQTTLGVERERERGNKTFSIPQQSSHVPNAPIVTRVLIVALCSQSKERF